MSLEPPSTELLFRGPDQTISIFKPETATFSPKESDRKFLGLYGQGTLGDSVSGYSSVHKTRKGDTEMDWAPGQSLMTL